MLAESARVRACLCLRSVFRVLALPCGASLPCFACPCWFPACTCLPLFQGGAFPALSGFVFARQSLSPSREWGFVVCLLQGAFTSVRSLSSIEWSGHESGIVIINTNQESGDRNHHGCIICTIVSWVHMARHERLCMQSTWYITTGPNQRGRLEPRPRARTRTDRSDGYAQSFHYQSS